MGLFKAGVGLFKSGVKGAENIAGAGQRVLNKAVSETVNTVKESVQDVATRSVEQVQNKVNETVNSINTAGKVVTDAVKLTGDIQHGAKELVNNTSSVAGDLLKGRLPTKTGVELVRDSVSDGLTIAKSVSELAKDSLNNVTTLGKWAYNGDALLLGNPDGLLGVNFFGSFLGGNKDQGLIPDTRGVTGSVPLKLIVNGLGIDFGGEIPLNQLLGAVLSANPYTAALAPTVAAINLGGVGVTGRLDTNGFSFKIYGVGGPSYDAGAGSFGSTAEVGSYNKVQLLSWNDTKLKDLPLVGDVLGKVPLIKDVSIPVAKIDIQIDSKLYAQLSASVELLGHGPKGQVEVIHDLDNTLRKLFGIAKETGLTAIDETGQLIGKLAGYSPAPELEVIGSNTGPETIAA